jgi:hypothetical protein
MDKELEIERMKLELIKVSAAKAEMEFLIKQRHSEIKRIQENIKVQADKEVELRLRIEEALKTL